MRFLLDQSTDRRLLHWLRQHGHDATVIAVDYPPSLPDTEVLTLAHGEQRILITEDRDFGELVFRQNQAHMGIVYLRLGRAELPVKEQRLAFALSHYAERLDEFLVVTLRSVRVRVRPNRE